MHRVLLLHSNDLHGRINGLAQIATLVEHITADQAPNTSVIYLDAGDSEDSSVRLSNLTKGSAMHPLLSTAGCQAATVGNAAVSRYGAAVLAAQAEAATYPLLLANLRDAAGDLLPGTQATTMLTAGPIKLGLIGVTASMFGSYEEFFGLRVCPILPLVRELAAQLRQQGANAIVLLSHLGIDDDRLLAPDLANSVDVIIGAHSHTLLPAGEWMGKVLIAQAGNYAEHLGQIELAWDGSQVHVVGATVHVVEPTVPGKPTLLATLAQLEAEVEARLHTVIAELPRPFDFRSTELCGVGTLLAEVLRERMAADIGLISLGHAWLDGLPNGPLQRLTLYERCPSTGNPGIVELSGAQLEAIVRRGRDPEFAADALPRALRGRPRGLLHLSGAEWHADHLMVGSTAIDPLGFYRVAASDWEFESYGGYVDETWQLKPRYDSSVILREVVEAYLSQHYPPTVVQANYLDEHKII